MATIQMRLENADAVYAKLKALPDEKAPKFMRMMVSDMKSRGPTLIAKTGASVYNIAAAKLNPKTKAGSTRAYVHMMGDTLGSISWHYSGPRLKLGGGATAGRGSWPIRPTYHSTRRAYTLKTSIIRGSWSELGRWEPPRGPRTRPASKAPSPLMIHPWIRLVMARTSPGHAPLDEGPKVGLSVAQVVLSHRTEAQLNENLLTLALTRLVHNIRRESLWK